MHSPRPVAKNHKDRPDIVTMPLKCNGLKKKKFVVHFLFFIPGPDAGGYTRPEHIIFPFTRVNDVPTSIFMLKVKSFSIKLLSSFKKKKSHLLSCFEYLKKRHTTAFYLFQYSLARLSTLLPPPTLSHTRIFFIMILNNIYSTGFYSVLYDFISNLT